MSENCHLNIPPLIICLILAGCYFIYVVSFCTYIKESLLASVFYILGLNFFFFMTGWAFFVAVFTPNADIPRQYVLTDEDLALLHDEHERDHKHIHASMAVLCDNKDIDVVTRTRRGHVR